MRVFVVSSLLLALHCDQGLCKEDRSSKNSKRGIFNDFAGSHENHGGNSVAILNENRPYGGGYGGSYRNSYGASGTPVVAYHHVPNSITPQVPVGLPRHYPFSIPKTVPAAISPHAAVQIRVPIPQQSDVPQRPHPLPVRASTVPQAVPADQSQPQPQPQQQPHQGPSRVPKTIFDEYYPHQPIQYEEGYGGGYENGYDEGYQGHYGGEYGHEGTSYSTSVFHHNPHAYSGYSGGATSYSSVYRE